MHALHGTDLLRKRTIMRLTLAAMVASSILAPLVLGAVTLSIGSAFDGSGPGAISLKSLAAAALAMVPAALFGGFAMHRGASQRSESATIGWAVLGGVLFLGAAIVCSACTSAQATELPRVPELMMLAVMMTGIGSILSAPAGFAFGLLFLIALSAVVARLDRPAEDTPAHAALASTAMLFVAAAVSLVPASAIEADYFRFVVTHLGAGIPAWTRFAVFTGPLALTALAFLLVGLSEKRTYYRARRAILRGTHPEYYPGDIAPDEDAVPLTEADRRRANKRTLMRRESSAYRGGEGDATRVYVGLDSTASRSSFFTRDRATARVGLR